MKRSTWMVAALVALAPMAACKKKEGEATKEAPKTTAAEPGKDPAKDPAAKPAEPPKAVTGEDLAKRYVECWGFYGAKDWKNFETCYTPNATSDFVDSGMPPVTGYKEIWEKHTKPAVDAFPDAKGEVELTLINGKNGVTVALYTGTHTGALKSPMGEIPPTNKKVGVRVAHAVHFADDGKAVDKQQYYQDMGTVMSQLGLSPAPARPVIEKANPNVIVVAKDDANEKRNIEAVNKGTELFNKRDWKGMEPMMADDLVWSEIGMPKDWNKKESFEAHADMAKGFSDLKITPTTTWAAGDYVVVQGLFEGTNDGDVKSMGLKKTGKKVSLNFLQVYKLTPEGKLQGSWGYWNGAAFAQQLGLVPPPKAGEAPKGDAPKGDAPTGDAQKGAVPKVDTPPMK